MAETLLKTRVSGILVTPLRLPNGGSKWPPAANAGRLSGSQKLQGNRARGRLLLAICLASSCVGVAFAQDDDGALPQWYAGPLAGVVLPDSARNADQGSNLQVVIGALLAESLAVELTGFGSTMKSGTPGADDDTLLGGGLDLTLGTPAPGNPIFIVGGGAVEQELGGVSSTNTFGNLGLGVYLPFSFAGELWRLEGRYNVVFNDHPSLPADDLLEDGRINLGILFTFGELEDTAPPVEVAEAAPDADGDGVPDAIDKCPDTPTWVRPDANGCTPDLDGDGVDEAHDCCPASPAGVPVDANGCPPVPEPPPQESPVVQAPQAMVDDDRDGVPDGQDACPHTPAGLEVDAKGCVRPENVTLRNVHFALESARLTADGYLLLRQVAAALKADPAMRLEVSGHADNTGSNRYNERLSVRRAETVHDFLNYLGISQARMVLKAYGETKPVADNKTLEGRATNRRVEFRKLNP